MLVPGAVADPAALWTERPSLATSTHRFAAYAAWARAEGRYPGILVIHAAGGVNDHTQDICRRLAAQGFLALAPDLLARVGGAAPAGDMAATMDRLAAMRDQDALADMTTAVRWLRANDRCNGRIGAVGFCMGGRLALLAATEPSLLDAAVDCWGGRITARTAPPDANRPEVVVDRVATSLSCPVLGLFGEDDHNPNSDDVAELRAALERSGMEHRVVTYPGAGHAFMTDDRESYRPEPAFAAWDELIRWLGRLRD